MNSPEAELKKQLNYAKTGVERRVKSYKGLYKKETKKAAPNQDFLRNIDYKLSVEQKRLTTLNKLLLLDWSAKACESASIKGDKDEPRI